ncbi:MULTISPECIES: hypothetical protein [unclassified Rhizobium]|uniref:hypothetical protein n=1 Tax=unclassified Rhizobium TaxID=2613769 RepID=UPI001ADAD8F1|nr:MULTISPECIES: hypothetical protein [unclassified Rhizobium]MBO9122792.1 hypothetical protein [Rhizobium sp. 16-488-2b]MBO9173324.1 hypothetical protein [Rhizobium sp. 16-488-2a]
MTTIANRQRREKDPIVNLMLNGGRVTATFREALFDATAREGLSVNEFCLKAAAEKLKASGREFSGVFHPGDFAEVH